MYGTDWKEVVAADEEARFVGMSERIAAIKAKRDARYGERARALHRQAIAGVLGSFAVRDDLESVLPKELHSGPFQPGARFATYARFSNGSWERAPKDVPDVRGFALKLVGVGGKKLLTGEDEPYVQDFLLNQTPVFSAKSPEEFIALIDAASKSQVLIPFRLVAALGVRRGLAVLRNTLAGLKKPFPSFLRATFFSMVPYRLGPTAARWSLTPASQDVEGVSRDLRSDLKAGLRNGAAWTFRTQLYQDERRTPIEDPTVDWDAPWIDVARFEVPPTDLETAPAAEIEARVEGFAFDPWNAVEELRPLGVINRARKAIYFTASVQCRDTLPQPAEGLDPQAASAPTT